MNQRLEIEDLYAELAAVDSLLEEAKSLDDPVGVLQYTQRQTELQARIHELQDLDSHQASVVLRFDGKPVLGSRGIAADFAGGTLR